jgi:hypothetical protein
MTKHLWLIVGSTATKHWFPEARDPFDLDILSSTAISSPGVVDVQWHDEAEFLILNNKDKTFADPNTLFTMKVSHAHWDIKWDKTMFDIQFLKEHGCNLNFELYKRLFKVHQNIHGKKQVNLKQKVQDFFDDNVCRKYNHEFLHEIVSFGKKPFHEYLRDDKESVWCSEEKFNLLSYEDQIKGVLEEIMVTSIERFSLTADDSYSKIRSSLDKAHKLLVTSMTTGWFARFLILNKHELLFKGMQIWKPQINKALVILKHC